MRVCIVGGPRTGKTTLASTMLDPLHTDDLIGALDWSAVSEIIATQWMSKSGPWVIEGVALVRALRKWLERNAAGKPCDRVIVLRTPEPQLRKRGVEVVEGDQHGN
jgi:broad-specificity NMP kinase